MKKTISILFATFWMFAAINTTAQLSSDKQFKELYKKAVKKMAGGGVTQIQLKDNTLGIVEVQYEEKHTCMCKDKECHGPRLTITVREIKTDVILFPSGHYFAEVNHFKPGDNVVIYKLEPGMDEKEELSAQQAARRVLLAYCK
ncbi:hypothetical protein A3I25_00205 [Candidatus Nomurabacteria bacterium RIFCSPLOWO2_02_FULL_42_17]|uniref:Uncharacterized protein n=2 Tax=Candidatus Nomuraibacteriota TaxID=1752729 RepID=A0A1F6WHT6_9BACT|nr:MAG: hypothetical protein UV08_C0007G0006 [Parcubacteria group bacterium GW2011_GWA2_42_18]OGI81346.1 MAG: hypothetical protein A3B93_01170 [Candidatus Nomurabacteria bacterium RIFCSPHIGHO2_02_FULL_42_24]OGI97672.1 MAG: hypothetical protein A3I25_00205 [Candidatus Nomurabacteria bacterium RIFCSPLOWO2_02_FULL_42_17]